MNLYICSLCRNDINSNCYGYRTRLCMYHRYLLQIHVLPSPVNNHLYASEIQKIWLIIFVNAKHRSQERIVTKVSNLSKPCHEVMVLSYLQKVIL